MAKEKLLNFSGYEWRLKNSPHRKIGPGPNFWSQSPKNVYVDKEDRLHLKIVPAGNRWFSTEVEITEPLGYGEYCLKISCLESPLDRNAIFGFFIYLNDRNEIDIELGRWGGETKGGTFALQPSFFPGNLHRYSVNLTDSGSTLCFGWFPDRVEFSHYFSHYKEKVDEIGTDESNGIAEKWVYRGESIPAGPLRAHINFWLYRGENPKEKKPLEITVREFNFEPLKPGEKY